jgi:predicted lipoprotein with Yx(FWY)xxD motif
MKTLILSAALMAVASPAFAAKPCEELKSEIAAKLDEKKVAGYTLDIVDPDKAGERKVVGSCDGGKKKIVYEKAAK